MKKIFSLIVCLVLLLGVVGCDDVLINRNDGPDDKIQNNNNDNAQGNSYEKRFDNAIANFKNAKSFYVKEEREIKGKNSEYEYETKYIIDKNNNIINVNNGNGFIDFKNKKYIMNEKECNFGWIYDNLSSEYDIDHYYYFSYPLALSKDDIISYEDDEYLIKISIDKLKDYKGLTNDYLKSVNIELKISLENENISEVEYTINDGRDTTTIDYEYSGFNKAKTELSSDAQNARYKQLGWQSCNE